jgi:LCP family protein required for cell wall assembly
VNLMPHSRGGALWRFLLAAVLVVALTATATAVAGLLQVRGILAHFTTPALLHARVTLPSPGAPETLLLIGSDHRAGQSYKAANTDTMMLVRLDDSSQTINLLSVPRDLEVALPTGAGVTGHFKLNAAYSIGGPNLLIKTLQDQVFPGLHVNHILDVNFKAFSGLIDAIGCVYADVDHRYYNNTALTNYSSIDIQPGYQKLCGGNNEPNGALAFVRFRHTDSDIVRNARQQDFIRWAKSDFSTDQILAERDRLLQIFGENVQTDRSLHSTDGLLELFDLVINADKLTLKSIPFPYTFTACGGGTQTPCYVTSTPEQEQAAFRKFMTPTRAPIAPPASAQPAGGTIGALAARPRAPSTAGLLADTGDGKSQSAQLGRVPFPVLYPKLIVRGAQYCFAITANCDDGSEPQSEYTHSYPRKYVIHGIGGVKYPSYVMTLVINSTEGQYYTVQGTTWRHPPILRKPSKVETVNGKKLFEYSYGGKLGLVAFRTPLAVYWIANTLTDSIPASQMVAMAASLTPAS